MPEDKDWIFKARILKSGLFVNICTAAVALKILKKFLK